MKNVLGQAHKQSDDQCTVKGFDTILTISQPQPRFRFKFIAHDFTQELKMKKIELKLDKRQNNDTIIPSDQKINQ